MLVTIDGAGRVVVPAALRRELGLQAGSALTIHVSGGRLELEPAPANLRLERRGKRLVAVCDEPLPPLSADDVRRATEAQRR